MTTSQAKPSRAFYSASITDFITAESNSVLGYLAEKSGFSIETTQRDAWQSQITILQNELVSFAERGSVFFEFVVPRLGKRIDVLALIDHVIFVIEFKVGESVFNRSAIDQVWDYALDLKNFHETSHHCVIAPLLVATNTKNVNGLVAMSHHNDGVLEPINTSPEFLKETINTVLQLSTGVDLDASTWESGRYRPTPTIIEAASALYGNHSVADLSRSDAGEKNLARTSVAIGQLITEAQANHKKAICFVTGVPGAGKTLVGLDVATKHMDAESDLHSVYLSGNGPLVSILREALTRDEVARKKAIGQKLVVKVLRDRRQSLHPDEYHYFQNRIKHCRVREVLLCANETPLVIARSIIPTLSSSGSNHSILRLGTKPLGAVQFSKTRMHSKTRPQRDIARIDRTTSLWQSFNKAGIALPSSLWARRTLYHLKGHPILVNEVFLPALLKYPAI